MSTNNRVRVTFGMIVLNGEPFVRANLRALYPYAHQIIVVEGASPLATEFATADGHSLDATLASVREFIQTEDQRGIVQLVTAEDEGHPNGFWPREKTQQSQAYATRATGNYLWQIDVDEFYQPEDMQRVLDFLAANPHVNGVLFGAYHFFGGTRFVVEGGYIWHPAFQGECFGRYRRLFRWKPEWTYAEHRPPTIIDERGHDIAAGDLVDCTTILGRRRVIYHYFRLSPEVIRRKAVYYSRVSPTFFDKDKSAAVSLLNNTTRFGCLRVFDEFGTWNWLERFQGSHPSVVAQLNREGYLDDAVLAEQIGKIAGTIEYRVSVAVLRILERARVPWFSGVFFLKRAIIRKAPSFPNWLWRFVPRRWHKYRDPYWHLEPWNLQMVKQRTVLT